MKHGVTFHVQKNDEQKPNSMPESEIFSSVAIVLKWFIYDTKKNKENIKYKIKALS